MTPLIVHPTTDFNTFIDGVDADAEASNYLTHLQWSSLTADDKQRWLLLSGSIIINLTGFEAPDTAVLCLPQAQMMIIMHQLKYALQDSTSGKANQLRAHKFDVMYREYFKNEGADLVVESSIPPEALNCLQSYGALPSGYSGGVGTLRRTR